MFIVCCVCKKVKTEDGWQPLPVREEDRPSHGFCPSCHQRTLRLIANHANKADHARTAA